METYNSIELTKQLVKDGKISQEIAETIFPELKESEDDSIRIWIKKELESKYVVDNIVNNVMADKALAWLEKQGEQNPKSADFIPTDCTSDAKNENRWHKVEDSLPDNAREVLCKDAIGNFFIGRYYNDGDYWEVSMYDEPDKSNKDNPPVIMWMNIPSCEQNLANSAKTCKDEPKFKVGDTIHEIGERHIFPMVIEKIEDGDYVCDNGSSFINIEFQDKYELVEQNPAWSEADENRLKVVISFVNSNPAEDPFYDKGCLKDWLKSLKDRYTWKPSDEQMEALIKKACDFFEENIEEEDCKIGSSEWTELRAEYKSLDSFIRAFRNYMKGE